MSEAMLGSADISLIGALAQRSCAVPEPRGLVGCGKPGLCRPGDEVPPRLMDLNSVDERPVASSASSKERASRDASLQCGACVGHGILDPVGVPRPAPGPMEASAEVWCALVHSL